MVIDIKKLQDLNTEVTITNKDELFKNILDDDTTITIKVVNNVDSRFILFEALNENKDLNDNIEFSKIVSKKVLANAIVKWSGFVDADGNELPCTNEYKELLLERLNGFYGALEMFYNKLQNNQKEDIEKKKAKQKEQ